MSYAGPYYLNASLLSIKASRKDMQYAVLNPCPSKRLDCNI